jgi:hypothetical protein
VFGALFLQIKLDPDGLKTRAIFGQVSFAFFQLEKGFAI